MSKLFELIEELCPDGVEYRPLGEVGEFLRGSSLQKKHLTSEGVPCIHYGQVYTRYGLSANETYSFLKPEFATGKRTMTTGDLFIATTSENEEDLGKAVAWLGHKEVVASNDAFIYRHNLDPLYVSYFFDSSSFHEQKYRFITGTKVKRLSGDSMAKIIIPVPPLEVQQEIVRVLDAFTDLEQSLVSELELRKKQFEEYRSHAFLKINSDTIGLKHIAEIGTGGRNTNQALDDGPFPFYTRGEEIRRMDEYDFDETAIITAGDGVGVGKTMHFVTGKYALHQRAYRINVTHESFDPRYVFHLMRATFLPYMIRNSVHASVTSVRKKMLDEFPVPVVDVEMQSIIVNKFDAFEALIQSIEQEINLRRKQYEFYRDELLTFTPQES